MPERQRPIQKFLDDIAPAQLLLQIYRLLETDDRLLTEGEIVESVRQILEAPASEELMLLRNEVFLGIVRERADLPRRFLKTAFLAHLLRQSIVVSCTALEAFLPELLQTHLETVVRVQKRDFLNRRVKTKFKDLTFTVEDALRIAADAEGAPLFIANKIRGHVKYLGGADGVEVTCELLGLSGAWEHVAQQIARDAKELRTTIDQVVNRRHDIVHRADRPRGEPTAEPTPIQFGYANQGVETISSVCHAVNEIVERRIAELAQHGEAA